jgi:hypothetical protein
MNKWVKITGVLALMLAVQGCSTASVRGNGDIVTQDIESQSFSEVSLRGNYSATINVGEAESIAITTDANIQPYIATSVSMDRLTIKNERSISATDKVKIIVGLLELNELNISGSNRVAINGKVTGDLSSSISGSGSIELESIEGDTFEVSVSGSGGFKATGSVETLDIDISGSSNLDLSNLNVKHAKVSISGSGTVKLGQVEKLDGAISGSGSISYQGSTMLSLKTSGSASVKSMGSE